MYKRNIFLLLFCAFFVAVTNAYSGTHKGEGYPSNTKVFSSLQDETKAGFSNGDYDYYFPIVDKTKNNYQLIYHHPSDYTADTNEYYIALISISGKDNIDQIKATYNNQNLPVAVNHVIYSHINIFLTRDQILQAYENGEKMIIKLTFKDKNYDIVFPNNYLRKAVSMSRYSTNNHYSNSHYHNSSTYPRVSPQYGRPVPHNNYSHPTNYPPRPQTQAYRDPFDYHNTYDVPIYSGDTIGDLIRYSFDYVLTYPCPIKFYITTDIQNYTNSIGSLESRMKSISIREVGIQENSCKKVEFKIYNTIPSFYIKTAKNADGKLSTHSISIKGIKEDSYIRNLRRQIVRY